MRAYGTGTGRWYLYLYEVVDPLAEQHLRVRGYRRTHLGSWFHPSRRSAAVALKLTTWEMQQECRTLAGLGFRLEASAAVQARR